MSVIRIKQEAKKELIDLFEIALKGQEDEYYLKKIKDYINNIEMESANIIGNLEKIISGEMEGNFPPNERGVYFVLTNNSEKIKEFKKTSDMRPVYKTVENQKKQINWYDELQDKWNLIKPTSILYIGKAGGKKNKLKQRVKQYIKYRKKGNNHAGGRAIWQINGDEIIDNLLIVWVPIPENGVPEEVESKLIKEYVKEKGYRPLANQRN